MGELQSSKGCGFAECSVGVVTSRVLADATASMWTQIALAGAGMIDDAAAESGRTPCSPGACRADSGDATCETVHAGFKLTADSFFYFILIFFLDLCVFTYFGQFLVFLTPSQGMAQIIASGERCLPLIGMLTRQAHLQSSTMLQAASAQIKPLQAMGFWPLSGCMTLCGIINLASGHRGRCDVTRFELRLPFAV